MNLIFNKLQSGIPAQSTPIIMNLRTKYSTSLQGPDRDTFVKNSSITTNTPTFKGAESHTKEGACLKELDNITCPYSGVKMISGKNMDKLERQLYECDTMADRIMLLEKYKPCMQKLEKDMFAIFKGYEKAHPEGTMNSCLQEMKPNCLAKLKIEQLGVLDKIDKISNKLDAKSALEIRKITTNARIKVVDDNQQEVFKRKDILLDLFSITSNRPDDKHMQELWQTASKLPKSTTDMNAFVVKYADRSPHEIAARLLRPSVASIEHISPKSLIKHHPDNTLANFMLVSKDWNSDRGNEPLPEYIKEHPKIPKYSQRYVNDIIHSIHSGALEDVDWYPYFLKEKLYNESNGMIDVNLDKYKVYKDEAFMFAPEEIVNKYSYLVEQNKKIQPATV